MINLDQDTQWELTKESDEQTYFNLCYTFRLYERKN
jgi:dihydrofolate reductase